MRWGLYIIATQTVRLLRLAPKVRAVLCGNDGRCLCAHNWPIQYHPRNCIFSPRLIGQFSDGLTGFVSVL
jgi:hypothetical protein